MVYYTKIKRIPNFLDIVMLIGKYLLWIDAQLQGIVFSLDATIFLGKSKKQSVVAQPSVQVEYSTMVFLTCELVWVIQCLQELIFYETQQMKIIVIIKQFSTSSLILYYRRGPKT